MEGCQTAVAGEGRTPGVCPKCRSTESYRLGDGRAMCKDCRTKYTPVRQLGRLGDSALEGMAGHFWQMTPMDAVARDLGVNRKTVHRYFGEMRRRIAGQSETEAEAAQEARELCAVFVGDLGSKAAGMDVVDTVTVFGLLKEDQNVRLVFTRSWSDWSGLDLSSLRVKSPGRGNGNSSPEIGGPEIQAQAFWAFARARLRHYRGGFMKRLPVYLREMEFRYNHRRDPGAVDKLLGLLQAGPM